jgi:hypothetical protein
VTKSARVNDRSMLKRGGSDGRSEESLVIAAPIAG